MFLGKDGSLPILEHSKNASHGLAPALPANIRLAYWAHGKAKEKIKCFKYGSWYMLLHIFTFTVLRQRVWVNVVKHFTVVIYDWAEYARVQALQALSDICRHS
jgi:hypothetical protein